MPHVPKEASSERPLIIGQAPARGRNDQPAFSSASGARLAQLAGVGDTAVDLQQHFETMNLVSRYGGKKGKGDAFDIAAAKTAASSTLVWLESLEEARTVLFMGRGVAKAFHFQDHNYLIPWQWGLHTFVVFPHPSGVNRWWNEEWNVQAAKLMLGKIVHGRPLLYV